MVCDCFNNIYEEIIIVYNEGVRGSWLFFYRSGIVGKEKAVTFVIP